MKATKKSIAAWEKLHACTHPGTYHLAKDGTTIVKPHPQANTCFSREQGYVVARIEPAYAELAPAIVEAMNAAAARTKGEPTRESRLFAKLAAFISPAMAERIAKGEVT